MGTIRTASKSNGMAADSAATSLPGTSSGVLLTGEILGIVIGSLSGVLVLVAVVVVVVIYRKHQRRKAWNFEYYDLDDESTSKSAPISRSASPKFPKRKSCPDIHADARNVMVRSATSACVPDFILPPERIQPYSDHASGQINFLSPENCVGIRPDLYRPSSESDDDSGVFPPSEHGRIWFTLVYDGAVEQLNVKLVKVKELPGRRNGQLRDPFVRIFLLPDERNSKTSKVKKKTLTPIYNETFIFQLSAVDIDKCTLRFSVYDVDRRRLRHVLGHAFIPLCEIDKTKVVTMWRDLEPNSHICNALGDIHIGLCYLPSNDKIKVIILNARHLRHLDYDMINGIYVKVQMNHARRPYKSKKTMVRPTAEDPTFNEAFSFCTAGQPIETCNFVVSIMVCPKKYLGQNEIYGKAIVGSFMYARGEDLVHWQEMISQPRSTVNKWHSLTYDI
ncbi:synaptotagmin-2-like [Mytilus trossulus]|uniref:synaptotagmin-2-like n=1 Tax=Mytilus trossulus TaxID=6551 RepID=UPI003007D757